MQFALAHFVVLIFFELIFIGHLAVRDAFKKENRAIVIPSYCLHILLASEYLDALWSITPISSEGSHAHARLVRRLGHQKSRSFLLKMPP